MYGGRRYAKLAIFCNAGRSNNYLKFPGLLCLIRSGNRDKIAFLTSFTNPDDISADINIIPENLLIEDRKIFLQSLTVVNVSQLNKLAVKIVTCSLHLLSTSERIGGGYLGAKNQNFEYSFIHDFLRIVRFWVNKNFLKWIFDRKFSVLRGYLGGKSKLWELMKNCSNGVFFWKKFFWPFFYFRGLVRASDQTHIFRKWKICAGTFI